MRPEHWIGIIAGIVIPIIGWIVYHALHDKEVQADLKSRVTRIEVDIGTHTTGLRGDVHKHGNALTWLGGCVWVLASKIGISLPKKDDP